MMIVLLLILSIIPDNVLDQVLTEKYSLLLSMVNITDCFLRVSWVRYRKLIPWVKNEGTPMTIVDEPLVVIKLYLFYHPDKATDIIMEILRTSMFFYTNEYKMKLYRIISFYKCDYEIIMKNILENSYNDGALELVKSLIERLR